MIGSSERETLLRLARAAIGARARGEAPPSLPAAPSAPLLAGAFVTLHAGDELRGCMGHVEADRPLTQSVVSCAATAASADPRFPPVTADEVAGLTIEISVLGPLEPVVRIEEIEVGRHGLVVEQGWHRGLLLPQVATEWGWDREAFVEHTCQKAGLPLDAWQNGAHLWRFEAEVFGEPATPPAASAASRDSSGRADRSR